MLPYSHVDGRVDAIDETGEIGRDTDDEGYKGAEVNAVGVTVDAAKSISQVP